MLMREMVNDEPGCKKARVALRGRLNGDPFFVERSTTKGGAGGRGGKSELLFEINGQDCRG